MYHVTYNVSVNPGDTYTFDWPLWLGTEMRALWLRRPSAEGADDLIPELSVRKGLHIAFLQLVPLYEGEVEFLRQHGARAFWSRSAELDVPLWDPLREPAELALG